MKFRKKPVIINAEQWFPGSDLDGVEEFETELHYSYGLLMGEREYNVGPKRRVGKIKTLEGGLYIEPGDWVITGIKGEKYPCKPDIFEATYEKVEG